MGQSKFLNQRYEAYLVTTDKPTNYGYMAFINDMKRGYTGECPINGKSIDNQDEFTKFIQAHCYLYVGRVIKNETK